jgi:uncharacterized protein (DUF2267 family)
MMSHRSASTIFLPRQVSTSSSGRRRWKHERRAWWQIEALRFAAELAPECQLLEQRALLPAVRPDRVVLGQRSDQPGDPGTQLECEMRGGAGGELTDVSDGRASGKAAGLLGFRHVRGGRPRRVCATALASMRTLLKHRRLGREEAYYKGVATQRNEPPVDLSYPDGWRYERFIVTIQQKAGVSWAEAEAAARATLGTLGERISRGDARALAGDLPDDLRSWLLDAGGADAEPFGAGEFVRRVAAREDVDLETAERHVRAVFAALARLVRRPEMSHLLAELPGDYAALLGDAASRGRVPGAPEVLAYEQFLQRVADRTALFPEQAGEVAAAVLEVLAERIAGGEADDLAQYLPEELRAALKRGKARTRGKAQRMSLDEFVRRVAEREGVDDTQAFEHAGAVLQTLRDSVPDKEFSDLLHQLPRAYQVALL